MDKGGDDIYFYAPGVQCRAVSMRTLVAACSRAALEGSSADERERRQHLAHVAERSHLWRAALRSLRGQRSAEGCKGQLVAYAHAQKDIFPKLLLENDVAFISP